MFKYFNPHPKGCLSDDCVKRAIVVTTGWDYMTVQKKLGECKRLSGAKSYNSTQSLSLALSSIGAEPLKLKGEITAREFCRKHRRGRFILDMAEHWCGAVDGDIYDTWDCSDEPLLGVFKVTTKKFSPPRLENQIFKYCCTSKKLRGGKTCIRIYDGNGNFVEKIIGTRLVEGYILCLCEKNYNYIKIK